MAKINPAIVNDVASLMEAVDSCGRAARRLVARGMDANDIKKAVKDKFKVGLGTYGAKLILTAIITVW